MKKQITINLIAACAGITRTTSLLAHDGHGLEAVHWHATDTLGFVTVACLAAAVIWLSRK